MFRKEVNKIHKVLTLWNLEHSGREELACCWRAEGVIVAEMEVGCIMYPPCNESIEIAGISFRALHYGVVFKSVVYDAWVRHSTLSFGE